MKSQDKFFENLNRSFSHLLILVPSFTTTRLFFPPPLRFLFLSFLILSFQLNMPIASVNPTFSTFFFLSLLIFLTLPGITRSDYTCQYPCYPPPTGGSIGTTPTIPSATQPPPAPPQSGTTYQPPSGIGYYPYIPPPPYRGSGGGNGGFNGYGNPPPPDSILPYFPYYYRKPPHMTEENSAGSNVHQWTGMVATISLFSLFLSV